MNEAISRILDVSSIGMGCILILSVVLFQNAKKIDIKSDLHKTQLESMIMDHNDDEKSSWNGD